MTINAVSSEYSVLPDFRRASALVTGNGLYGDFCTVNARNSCWMTSNNAVGSFTNAFVIFDLGAPIRIDQMLVWNYNESTTNTMKGIQFANISVAGNDMVFNTVAANQLFNRAPGTFTNNFQQYINIGATGRYVQINVLSNWAGGLSNYVGLSKVRFINTNTLPTIKRATRSFGGTKVTIQFSETVLPSSATNAANYTVMQGATPVTISNVVMDTFADRVVLNTSTMSSNLTYTLSAQNVAESTGVTALAATNLNIEPEFVLWFKSDVGVATSGNSVTTWADQSGAGNDASESNNVAQPTYITDPNSGINGKPVIHFNGASTGLASPHNSTLVAEADLSFFAVVRPASFSAYGALITKEGTPATQTNYPAPFDYELAVTTGKPRLLRGNGSVATTLNGTSNAVLNQPVIVELLIKGTNAMSYLNGFPNGNAVFADGIEDQGNPVRIGRREDNSLYFNGDMAEIMFMRGALSDTERSNVDVYLARKWSIITPTVGPPIILTQPTNTLSYVGFSATFTTTISTNGGSPKTYQWFQTPNTAIPNATNTSLTLSNLTLAQDSTTYFFNATNVDGSTNSVTVTLNVLPLTAPFFSVQPVAQTGYIHQPVSFSANALGSPSITYQWYYNNTLIVNATNRTLAIDNLSLSNNGNISVVASNSFGVTTSSIVALSVILPSPATYAAGAIISSPVIYYPFNDLNNGVTNTANYGSLGAAFNGSLQGTWTADNGPQSPNFPMFDSTNLCFGNTTLSAGGVQFPLFNLYNTNGGPHCTFAAWVYKDFGQAANAGIIFSRPTGVCGIAVNAVNGNDEFIYTWNNGQFGFHSGLLVPNSVWVFVAAVIEPTRATLYMNDGTGFRAATNTVAAAVVPSIGGYVGWDNFAATRRWFGDIDEPMIFDRALGSNEVVALYTTSPLAPTNSASLAVTRPTNGISITWPKGFGTLQKANKVGGPYTDMFGITSPFVTSTNDAGFYRLRVH